MQSSAHSHHLLLLLSWFAFCATFAYACDSDLARSCMNVTVDVSSSGDYESTGYKTNFGYLSFISSADGFSVECQGSSSCGKATISSDKAQCSGARGCVDSNVHAETSWCYAAAACADASLVTLYGTILCSGDASCSRATISDTTNVTANGAFSLYQAFVYATYADNKFSLQLNGFYSGYGLVVICADGHSCSIVCNGNACSNAIMLCEEGSECYVSAECDESVNIACPTLFSAVSSFNLQQNFLTLTNTSGDTFYFNRTYPNFISMSQLSQNSINLIQNPLNLSFNAVAASLVNEANCAASGAYTLDDGSSASEQMLTHSEGNICARGAFALHSYDDSEVSRASVILDNFNDYSFDIVCSGFKSCKYIDLFTTRSLGNIYCSSFLACWGSTFIENVNIICSGRWSCTNTVVQGVQGLICSAGYEACGGMAVYNVENVVMTGFSAIGSDKTSVIYSNGTDLNLYLYVSEAGLGLTVYCQENDDCTIDCGVNGACNDLVLVCQGNCQILCDESNGTECPGTVYSAAPSDAPTRVPTIKSFAPTLLPSVVPSFEPTLQPNDVMSLEPSAVPTMQPTQETTNETSNVRVTSGSTSSQTETQVHIAQSTEFIGASQSVTDRSETIEDTKDDELSGAGADATDKKREEDSQEYLWIILAVCLILIAILSYFIFKTVSKRSQHMRNKNVSVAEGYGAEAGGNDGELGTMSGANAFEAIEVVGSLDTTDDTPKIVTTNVMHTNYDAMDADNNNNNNINFNNGTAPHSGGESDVVLPARQSAIMMQSGENAVEEGLQLEGENVVTGAVAQVEQLQEDSWADVKLMAGLDGLVKGVGGDKKVLDEAVLEAENVVMDDIVAHMSTAGANEQDLASVPKDGDKSKDRQKERNDANEAPEEENFGEKLRNDLFIEKDIMMDDIIQHMQTKGNDDKQQQEQQNWK